MRSTVDALRELAASWILGDRIRISPTAGRLLSLKPGDEVMVRGQLFKVRTRAVRDDRLVYQFHGPQQSGRLTVDLGETSVGSACGELVLDDVVQDIFDDDMVVLSPGSRYGKKM